MSRPRGQILVVAILLLAILAALVPVLALFASTEERWTVKAQRNADAFQLAEGAVDRGFTKVTESTGTWAAVQAGTALPGFSLDAAYGDLAGGEYAVRVTSGPGKGAVTVVGIGRDASRRETRAVEAVYADLGLSGVSILGERGVTMSGNNAQVEWGSIASPMQIDVQNKRHPSFWSAAGIDLDANGSAPPNCDVPNCWWWHSYYPDIPPMPAIDFAAYKSSAQASGRSACGLAYYQSGSVSGPCPDASGRTFYVEGDWTGFNGPISGNIIVLGNMSFVNGTLITLPSYPAKVPSDAWKQYCNDWSTYTGKFDPTNPYAACPGLDATYAPSGLSYVVSPAVHGFLYVGGDLTVPQGAGNVDLLHGVIVVEGHVAINANSHAHIYYDADVAAAVLTRRVIPARVSWRDSLARWPPSLP